MNKIITSLCAAGVLLVAPVLYAQPFKTIKVLGIPFFYSPQKTNAGETSYVYYPRGENEDNFSAKVEMMHFPTPNPMQTALEEEGQDELGLQKAYACPQGKAAVVAWISFTTDDAGEERSQLYMLSKIDPEYTMLVSGEFDLPGTDFSAWIEDLCAFELPKQ